MEKIIKSTQLVEKILGILFWVIVAVCGVSLVLMVAAMVFVDDATVLESSSVILGNYKLKVHQAYTFAQLNGFLWVMLVNIVLYGGLYCYVIRILQSVFKPMTQGKPFHTEVSEGLRKLSNGVLIFGVVEAILEIATSVVYNRVVDIAALFDATAVESYSIWIVGNVNFIVWFFVIRLFRRIFIYGETLQQLSDETL